MEYIAQTKEFIVPNDGIIIYDGFLNDSYSLKLDNIHFSVSQHAVTIPVIKGQSFINLDVSSSLYIPYK